MPSPSDQAVPLHRMDLKHASPVTNSPEIRRLVVTVCAFLVAPSHRWLLRSFYQTSWAHLLLHPAQGSPGRLWPASHRCHCTGSLQSSAGGRRQEPVHTSLLSSGPAATARGDPSLRSSAGVGSTRRVAQGPSLPNQLPTAAAFTGSQARSPTARTLDQNNTRLLMRQTACFVLKEQGWKWKVLTLLPGATAAFPAVRGSSGSARPLPAGRSAGRVSRPRCPAKLGIASLVPAGGCFEAPSDSPFPGCLAVEEPKASPSPALDEAPLVFLQP